MKCEVYSYQKNRKSNKSGPYICVGRSVIDVPAHGNRMTWDYCENSVYEYLCLITMKRGRYVRELGNLKIYLQR
jgi:hypothetical protein